MYDFWHFWDETVCIYYRGVRIIEVRRERLDYIYIYHP